MGLRSHCCFVNKALLKRSPTHHLHIASCCMAELKSCDRPYGPQSQKIFTTWPFSEKLCQLLM